MVLKRCPKCNDFMFEGSITFVCTRCLYTIPKVKVNPIPTKLAITVDTREPNDVVDIVRQMGYKIIRKKLEIGDYETRHAVFERKTAQDLTASMKPSTSGRIWEQMQDLSEYCEDEGKLGYLLITGLPERYESWKPVYGCLASISVRYGIQILQFENIFHALYVMCKIFEKLDEGKYGKPKRLVLRGFHPDKRVILVANVLRVSTSIAERLVERFGGLKNILLTDPKQLYLVPGVGPATLRRIKRLLE